LECPIFRASTTHSRPKLPSRFSQLFHSATSALSGWLMHEISDTRPLLTAFAYTLTCSHRQILYLVSGRPSFPLNKFSKLQPIAYCQLADTRYQNLKMESTTSALHARLVPPN